MLNFLKYLYNQTIVIWANPVNDGFGAISFDAPTEILGRWQDKVELLHSVGVSEQTSKAQVYTDAVIAEENWLYLGTLASLSTAEKANPKLINKAYEVIKIDKLVDLKNTTIIYRKASL